MKESVYLFNPGRMSRRQGTLCFTQADHAHTNSDADSDSETQSFTETDTRTHTDANDIARTTNETKTDEGNEKLFQSENRDSTDNESKNKRKRKATKTKPQYLPIENIADIYVFGSLDANSALFNFLGKRGIPLHFFDYYENYTGSFLPRDYLVAGKVQMAQAGLYSDSERRLDLARRLISGASANIVKNLKYYGGRGRNIDNELERIETIREQFDRCTDIAQLMGREGLIRRLYYRTFKRILQRSDLKFEHRSRRPPSNEVNALISFANSMVYSASLSQLYHTQLSPAISFLHEPGARRFSLALDLAEIFKPLLADRLIFSMLNRLELKARDFDRELFGCLLKKNAREKFVRAFDTRLKETIQHRTLHRSVSYRHLIRLECYKIEKHILGIEQYDPFVSWW